MRLRLLLATLLLSLTILSCENQSEAVTPLASDGVLDLREWDFTSNSPLEMAGEWEFYWNRLGIDSKAGNPMLITLPGTWKGMELDGKKLPGTGTATYRLTVLLPRSGEHLGIRLPIIFTTSRVTINSREMAITGHPGINRKTSRPGTVRKEIFFTPDSETLDIIIEVSNYHDVWGGLKYPLTLGSSSSIHSEKLTGIMFDVFLTGIIILFALYHLGLYVFRKSDKGALFFSLLCFSFLFSTLITGEMLLMRLFPELPWEIENKIEHITMHFAMITLLMFFYSQFKSCMNSRLTRILLFAGLSLPACVIVTPGIIYSHTLPLFYILIATYISYIIVTLVRAARKKNISAFISLVGILLFLVTIVNDILYYSDILGTIRISPFGLFLFILAQSFILARKFSLAYARVENLSVELEQKVVERTKELVEANNQKTRFFINIAHETRTPLTLISNYLDDFMKKNSNPSELVVVKTNLEKLKQDMVNYLDMEKLVNGRYIFNHHQSVDLSIILRDKIELYQKSIIRKNQVIKHELEPDCFVDADPMAVERIINNLLDNAVKYSPGNETISVILQRIGDSIQFIVKDNGAGIPEESLETIFKPFYQLSHEKDASQGIGMGLAIVHEIVEDLGGTITVKSTPGSGTRFIVQLDAGAPDPGRTITEQATITPVVPATVPPEVADSAFHEERENILVVEDNLDMLFYLVRELSEKYNVFHAVNGLNAMQRLKTIPTPHCIISDIMMDTMDGMELLDNLQKHETLSRVPFVFLTAKTSLSVKKEAYSQGAVDFIMKPFSISELLLKVNTLIKYHQKLRKSGLEDAIKALNRQITSGGNDNLQIENQSFEELCLEYELTNRQKEIIILLSRGLEYKEIGNELSIATKTVGRHIQNIYDKTGCHNKVEVVQLFRL
jgi:two-component system sensor histidine kinase ChiS